MSKTKKRKFVPTLPFSPIEYYEWNGKTMKVKYVGYALRKAESTLEDVVGDNFFREVDEDC